MYNTPNKISTGIRVGTVFLTIFFCLFAGLFINGFLNLNSVLSPSVFQKVDEKIAEKNEKTPSFAGDYDFMGLTYIGIPEAKKDAYDVIVKYFRAALNKNMDYSISQTEYINLLNKYKAGLDGRHDANYEELYEAVEHPEYLQIKNLPQFAIIAKDVPFPIINVSAMVTIIPVLLLLAFLVILNRKRLKTLLTCLGVVCVINGAFAFLWSLLLNAILGSMDPDPFNIILECIANNLILFGALQLVIGIGLLVLKKVFGNKQKQIANMNAGIV